MKTKSIIKTLSTLFCLCFYIITDAQGAMLASTQGNNSNTTLVSGTIKFSAIKESALSLNLPSVKIDKGGRHRTNVKPYSGKLASNHPKEDRKIGANSSSTEGENLDNYFASESPANHKSLKNYCFQHSIHDRCYRKAKKKVTIVKIKIPLN